MRRLEMAQGRARCSTTEREHCVTVLARTHIKRHSRAIQHLLVGFRVLIRNASLPSFFPCCPLAQTRLVRPRRHDLATQRRQTDSFDCSCVVIKLSVAACRLVRCLMRIRCVRLVLEWHSSTGSKSTRTAQMTRPQVSSSLSQYRYYRVKTETERTYPSQVESNMADAAGNALSSMETEEGHDADILAMLLEEEDVIEFAQETKARRDVIVKGRDLNSSRQRQREELQYLRRRVTELESELAAQKQINRILDRAPCADPDVSPTAVDGGSTLTTSASEWEAIAQRQKKARQRAELENHKLRQMVESQIKMAKTLEKLLFKRPNALHVEPSEVKRRRHFYQIIPDRDGDAGIFEELLASIERSYADTSVILDGNGLMKVPVGHRSVDIKTKQGNTTGIADVYVELTDVSTMPFSPEATASAMWRCISSGYMQLHHEIYKAYAGSDDILAIKYTITLTRRRLAVDFVARAAMKRFVEGDRVVDVWECLSDTEETRSGSNAPGIQVRERGWTVLRPINGGASTQILSCMQMHPLVIENNADEERQVGVLTNLALDYYGVQIDQAHHAIESLLLDETRSTVAISSLVDDI